MASQKRLTLRETLADFAQAMERKLRENDRKEGWEDEPLSYLLGRLDEEVTELKQTIQCEAPLSRMREECADVANFAMMIWDVLDATAGRANGHEIGTAHGVGME